VREIDALGGEMARAIDETGIQFRRLNTKKGPAVRATRAQADKALYRMRMKLALEREPRIACRQGSVERLLVEAGAVRGVETQIGEIFEAKTVILTTGALRGLIHVGDKTILDGRGLRGDGCRTVGRSAFASDASKPALVHGSIDDDRLQPARADGRRATPAFSFSTRKIRMTSVCISLYDPDPRPDRSGLDRSSSTTEPSKPRSAKPLDRTK
jgi:tRNA uridine 5-carboxymethylaminomethyl modification enzyme